MRIVTYIHEPARREPIPELADIWPRFQHVIGVQTRLNNTIDQILEQQLEIAREGRLEMLSPFSGGTDTSTESYYLFEHDRFFQQHRFFYRFPAAEEYYWITVVPEQLLSAIWFPARDIAVCLYPGTVDHHVMPAFERFRAELPERNGAAGGRRALVMGFRHSMHMLWNHLPALEAAIAASVAGALPVFVTHEPFGPTEELFPELAGRVSLLSPTGVAELNRTYPFLVGLGSRILPRSVRQRVQRVAAQTATPAALADRERLRAACSPVFWLSIKPPERTSLNQAEALAAIIAEIKAVQPRAGFVLDGASRPWDLATNENYDSAFRAYFDAETAAASQVIEDIVARLDAGQRADVVAFCGGSLCDEIAWEEIADFYFCHGGTPHHKIGWVRDTPGIMYSNARFIEYYDRINPVRPPSPMHYLPTRFVADDPESNYGADQLARRDQNFTLLAPREIAHEILTAWHEARSTKGHAPAETSMPVQEMPSAGNAKGASSANVPPEFFRIPPHTGLPVAEVVRLVHAHLRPKTYVEIGAESSSVLGAVECASIAIAERVPFAAGMVGGKPLCALFQMSADDFFATYNPAQILKGPIEVAYLHGIRLFEVLLRAFRSVERHCAPNSIVLVDGCVPVNGYAARRDAADARLARFANDADHWAGDAWKLPIILKKYRPELRIRAFGAAPAGLFAITNLNPRSDVLDKQYSPVTQQLRSALLNQTGIESFLKAMAVGSTDVFQRFETLSPLFWL